MKARGEHWVCSVLAGLGWSVALTREGLERTRHPGCPEWPDDRGAGQGRQLHAQTELARQPKRAGPGQLGPRVGSYSSPSAKSLGGSLGGFQIPRGHVAAAAWIGHMGPKARGRAAVRLPVGKAMPRGAVRSSVPTRTGVGPDAHRPQTGESVTITFSVFKVGLLLWTSRRHGGCRRLADREAARMKRFIASSTVAATTHPTSPTCTGG